MKKANEKRIETIEVKSSKGKYHLFRRHISLAPGGRKDTGAWGGAHPFDLELAGIPPGRKNWPDHAYSAELEFQN
ncbi:MAG TPA: hypothetical protein VNV43_15125 [Candidatus Acidoferrales bacterium]|nr:hypothetical protein [Candidatus Acidoferrales bacterium]